MSAAPVAAEKEKPKTIDDAAAQLKRLLITLPMLADDSAHKVADVAESLGVSEETLARDLRTLVTRFDDGPGGFVEGVRLAFGADTVQLESHLFKRPMGLTADEIGALEVGLAALERELPPYEAAVATQARARLVAAASEQDVRDGGAGESVASQLVGSELEGVLLSELRAAIGARRKVKTVYRSGGAPEGAARSVHPYGVVYSRGKWFLIGLCEKAAEIRIFRVDRMVSVSQLEQKAEIPDGFDLDGAIVDGRGVLGKREDKLSVKYSPAIARWIAEREMLPLRDDGSVEVIHQLLDDAKASRPTRYALLAALSAADRRVDRCLRLRRSAMDH